MRQKKPVLLATALCIISPIAAHSQFSSGSTGADGPLNVASNMTLNLPPGGTYNFTTINIQSNTTLRFNRNALNTPVYLLATGDVSIAPGGIIDVSGSGQNPQAPHLGGPGGPGGFDGGLRQFQGFPPGDGFGPGGAKSFTETAYAQGAAFAFEGIRPFGLANTNTYGNTLNSPLIGGSGGAGHTSSGQYESGGGGGGGAILVASSTKITINGTVRSAGGAGPGGGTGGAVRLVAPVVNGVGALEVPAGVTEWGGFSSAGRTRIDSLDRFAHRNLTLGGKGTRGSQMFVFPAGNPRLDIINAAGTSIPEGSNSPVALTLPVGSPTNQIVRVQARGFTNDIPIRVRITPENAPSATFDGLILQNSGNPPFADVQVALPLDTVCHVHAWTR